MATERVVLHVLPHPGGGGETYVEVLEGMEGYRFERVFRAPSAAPAGARASIVGAAAGVMRTAGRHDVVHVHGEVASAICLPALVRRPSVVTLHGLHLVRRLDGIRRTAASLNLRLLVRAASRTICVSDAELDSVRSIVGPAALGRVAVVRNGISTQQPVTAEERDAARVAVGVDVDAVVGAWIGSLDERKDPLTPVLAVRDAPASVTILVAGDGPLRSTVERRAGPRVRVLGFRDDVRQVLAASDFFVLSSQREGLSFALLEAMALGLVPLVTDAPENAEAVGGAGLSVGFGDVDAFAAAMTLLAGKESERRRLGLQARARVEQMFRSDEMIGRTRAVYDELSRSRGAA